MGERGFSLLEVLVALLLLTLISASFFAFISGEMSGKLRMEEKIRMLGTVSRITDTWIHQAPGEDSGEIEADGFLLRWSLAPLEEPRRLKMSGIQISTMQLCRMKLDVFRADSSSPRLSQWNFLVNRWRRGDRRE